MGKEELCSGSLIKRLHFIYPSLFPTPTPGDHLLIRLKTGQHVFQFIIDNFLSAVYSCLLKVTASTFTIRVLLLFHKSNISEFSQERPPGTLSSGLDLALDTFTLTEPLAQVSVFCQPAKLEATARFSYRKSSQKRSGDKPLLALLDPPPPLSPQAACSLPVFTICIFVSYLK